MSDRGIVLLSADPAIEARARAGKLAVVVDADMPLAFDKTLIVEPGTAIPWDLLPAAFHFLDRWDAAAPLWRYGVNACDVGTPSERKRTQAIVRDLRVLLYAHELLFLRKNSAGEALRAAFLEEKAQGGEERLAFLRAFYRVKPRMCVLPRSWLAEVRLPDSATRRAATAVPAQSPARRRAPRPSVALVQVEVAPGVHLQCRPGDEEQVRAGWQRARRRRDRNAR